MLIDAGAMSAGETLARDLVYSAEAHLMGSRTAGSSSAKRSWQLPGELGTVTLPTRSRWGFDGEPIEYNGIAPHEAVHECTKHALRSWRSHTIGVLEFVWAYVYGGSLGAFYSVDVGFGGEVRASCVYCGASFFVSHVEIFHVAEVADGMGDN